MSRLARFDPHPAVWEPRQDETYSDPYGFITVMESIKWFCFREKCKIGARFGLKLAYSEGQDGGFTPPR